MSDQKTCDYLEEIRTINVFNPRCPGHALISHIADKWTLLVILALSQGVKRHSKIMAQIQGISPKMLTQTLRKLESAGLVAREAFAEVPPRVEYRLTELGHSLVCPLVALCAWADDNYESIKTLWELD